MAGPAYHAWHCFNHENNMNPTGVLLATFILSIVGLFAFIWSLRKGFFESNPAWPAIGWQN